MEEKVKNNFIINIKYKVTNVLKYVPYNLSPLYNKNATQLQKLKQTLIRTERELKRWKTKKNVIELDSKIKYISYPQLSLSLNIFRNLLKVYIYLKEYKIFHKEIKKYKTSLSNNKNTKLNYGVESYKESDRYLKINDRYRRIYYLSDLPNYTLPGIFFRVINASMPINVSIHVKSTTISSMIKASRNTKAVLLAEVENRERKNKSISKDLQIQIEHVEEFEDKIIRGEEKAFLVSLYVSIEADSIEQLKELHTQFKNLTEESQLSFNTYTYGQLDAFKSILPLVQDNIKKDYVMQTTLVSYLMPFLSRNINDPDGIFIGRSSLNGQLVFFDLFKARNANINIFGTSGSGKSVTAKLIAKRLWLRKIQVIVLDPEGEYAKLALNTKGEIVKFNREYGINPFFIDSYDIGEQNDHIQILKSFFKFYITPQHYDSAVLDEALSLTYKKKNPNFDKFLKNLKHPAMVRDLKVLKSGSLGGIFNSDKQLNLKNDLIVFDLSDLESEDKKKPALFLLTAIIFKLIKKTDKQITLMIDEAHLFLKDPQTANFYLTLVKTARKYKTGIVSITQNLEDYYNDINKVGQGIITNAETTILLKQSFASLKYLKKSYALSDSEINILPTLNIGESLLFREKDHLRINITPLSSEQIFIDSK